MDTEKLCSLIAQFKGNIDDLGESLEPLIKAALSETANRLPLLDRSKLYVLVSYAIESAIFCSL